MTGGFQAGLPLTRCAPSIPFRPEAVPARGAGDRWIPDQARTPPHDAVANLDARAASRQSIGPAGLPVGRESGCCGSQCARPPTAIAEAF